MNIVDVFEGTKKEREIAKSAVEWCIKKLMPRMQTLEIEVEFEDIDEFGFCYMGNDNREFYISLKKNMSLYDLISTVCHEMVHVKQFARKELRDLGHTVRLWKNELYNSNIEYAQRPWEKEAFALEEKMALECFQEISVTAS